MNTLYFRGKAYPVDDRHPTHYLVDLGHSRLFLLQLRREDLQVLALIKYTGRIVRNHPDTLSPRVRSFLEAIAPTTCIPLPPDFIADRAALELRRLSRTYKVQDVVAPIARRIPHVKLVKASSLLPGMSIARWLMSDDEQPGRRHGRILDIRTVTLLGSQTYLQCSYKNNPTESASIAIPYSLWLTPQQLVPVLVGWRNKADV